MTDNPFIKLEQPEKKDNVIRTMYTPKEIVKIIQKHYQTEMSIYTTTRCERLMLWDSYNRLIGWFKDD